jgi:toxin ParE1/3/4
MSKYSFTRAANRDLLEILLYIHQRNSAAASKLNDRFHLKFRMLTRQPLIGEQCAELRPDLRSFTEGNYIIYYEPTENGVLIVRILHGWRDISQIFEGL